MAGGNAYINYGPASSQLVSFQPAHSLYRASAPLVYLVGSLPTTFLLLEGASSGAPHGSPPGPGSFQNNRIIIGRII